MRALVSVVVATLNEELHVERVVHSARDLGPVYVVDGGSSDPTCELAKAAGAHVIEHEWTGYAEQKNWALDNLPIGTEWVLFLDADEYLTPALVDEIANAVTRDDLDGFYLPEMNVFMGRPLRHAWWYPAYQLRLFRFGKGRYEERSVHESVIVDGRTGFLRETLYHESLKGIEAFVERHLRYARLEAAEMIRLRRDGFGGQRHGRLFGTWPERRRFLKLNVWYRVPARPLIRFLWLYVLRRGFLDGRPGRVYCSLLAVYEVLIDAMQAELLQAEEEEPATVPSPRAKELA
jgi:glycosyltransferase involved in cell wall biosynthesis